MKISMPSIESHSSANDTSVIFAILIALIARSLVPVALQAEQARRQEPRHCVFVSHSPSPLCRALVGLFWTLVGEGETNGYGEEKVNRADG
jgi:hypothetical protein